MDEDHNISERERALQDKIARLEKKLEGYHSQIGNTHKQWLYKTGRITSAVSMVSRSWEKKLRKAYTDLY